MDVPRSKGTRRAQQPSAPEEAGEEEECLCHPCLAVGEQRPAHGYCSDCEEYICRDCHRVHSKMKTTKNHVFLKKADMPRGRLSKTASDSKGARRAQQSSAPEGGSLSKTAGDSKGARRAQQSSVPEGGRLPKTAGDILTDVCPIHAGEITKFHCRTHDKLACTICTMLEHKACPDVRYIPDIAQGAIGSRHCKNIQQTTLELEEKMKNIEGQVVESREQFRKVGATYTKAVEDYRQQLEAIIDRLSAEAEEKKNAYMDKITRQLDNAQTVSREQAERLKSAQSDMDDRIKADRANSLYVSLKRSETLITECRNSIQTLEIDVNVPPFVFEKNTKLYNMLKDVDSIGKLDDNYPYLCDEINVKSPADSDTCDISALLVLSDGRIVVTDHNKAVKLFDSSHRCVSRVTLPAAPGDMAAVSRDELVVCLPNLCKLQFMSLHDRLTTGRHVNTGVQCRSVAVCGDSMFYTVDQTGNLMMMSKDGGNVATVWTHPTQWLQYVRVGGDNTLYVGHGHPGGVTCMSMDGAELYWTYTAADLQLPLGLAVQTDGTFYVCGCYSHNVHHVAADGGRIDVLLSQREIVNPSAVHVDHEHNTMYVGESDNNKIKLFKLRDFV